MERYRNRGGDSGVYAFEIAENYITVKFNGTARSYTYSYRKAGARDVENMKSLAISGSGLNSYINQHVKKLYD